MSLGTLLTAAACDTTSEVASNSNCPSRTEVSQTDVGFGERVEGDVAPVKIEMPDTIIEEPLMGIVAMFRMNYEFTAENYQTLMKDKFVFPKMTNLSVVGGNMEYERIARGEFCDTFEKLVEAASKFEAPYYPGGEQELLEYLALQLKNDVDKYDGDMEVAFMVDRMGNVLDVEVQKGIDAALDDEVAIVLESTEWHPAYYELRDDQMRNPFDCRCVLKIHFPLQ